MRSRILLSAIGLALAIGGCGGSEGSGGPGDKSAAGVRATVRTYLEDIKAGRGGDACDLLTDAARAEAGQGNPAACGPSVLLARTLLGAKALADLEAKAAQQPITIAGDHATTPAITPGSGTAHLVYSGGRWLIDRNS